MTTLTTQPVKNRNEVVLGLGQMRATKDENTTLTCLGLGSCVAFCVYDPESKVGGMAHMVLPASGEGRTNGQMTPKFVDWAIPMLVAEMEQLGANRSRLVIKIVGGAQMVSTNGNIGVMQIGDRNVEAARAVLEKLGLPLFAEEVGGTKGRTARLSLDSGALSVSAAGGESHEL